ncbi:MAG: Nramp family divalent metal transporter [Mitsuaria chitosanitabida]|uniref:Nramp family divalent metal transporter n=1 Tax=Roseateles chitosanitabidus TaxID=65048 RepID=UPI001B25E9BD|nr:Nramp family divalent metal transporter [Roseateles chitosanitabidus]MBO9687264.1 Nramp family divalent metal transporter [Roseateles chitosanitabidus]
MFRLPTTATAPFCPSEVHGSIALNEGAPPWKRLLRVAGPGLLISVGYMDPGNWATDIEAGSRFGHALLWVVLASSLAAMLLQTLSLRLGLVTGQDLAQACRERYRPAVRLPLWVMAELAIVACDVAEVLGTALALHLLFGVPLLGGVGIAALDTLIVLGLKGRGFRQVEAIILGLVMTIGICYAIQLALVGPDWAGVARGFIPNGVAVHDPKALLLAIGILGATVMPHNLYLHSSIVQTRRVGRTDAAKRDAIRLSTIDTLVSLTLALMVNAAILILAATAFHAHGHRDVAEIQDAYHLLDPLVGTVAASVLFGVALLAAGQSSTFTGTIAGQVLMEGFLRLKIPCWQRRLATRFLALVPAFLGLLWLGEGAVGRLLVASQVVLSLQLPFAMWPLIRMTNDRALMGDFANGPVVRALSWLLFALVTAANVALLVSLMQ